MKTAKKLDMLLRRKSATWSAEPLTLRGNDFLRTHVEGWEGGAVVFKETMANSINRMAFILDTERLKWDLVE